MNRRAAWIARTLLSDVAVGDTLFYRGSWWRVEKVGRLMVVLRARDAPKET